MPAALRWFLNLLPTNPICVRLVQGGSRRLRHLYIRAGYLAVLIVVLLFMLLQGGGSGTTSYRELAAAGAAAFQVVAYLQIGVICVLTPVFMAGALAQESNPKTWDVLLTTPLSAGQMVLGQLFGRLFFVLALLAASLPLFAITQYFGGVPGRSVLLSYVVSACAALIVGATAIALAVNRLAGKRAVFAFYVAVVSYLGVTAALDAFLQAGSPAGPGGVTLMTALNPFLALRALLNPSTYPVPDAVQLQAMGSVARLWFGRPVFMWCMLSGGLSAIMCAVSSITVREIGSRTGTPWYRKVFGLGAKGAESRPAREVWHNPIAWREAAARANTLPKLVARWGFIALGAAFGIGLTIAFHQGRLTPNSFRMALMATVWTELVIITLIAINMSATAISREREDGTLDLLLTTPISQAYYLNGKLRGLISYLAPLLAVPVFTVAIAGLYALLDGFGNAAVTVTTNMGTAGRVDAPIVLPEGAVILPIAALPFIAFCIIIGLQWSLKSKGTIGSVVATVGVVGAVAGVAGLCGWQAASEMAYVGPVLAGLNPVSLTYAIVEPVEATWDTVAAGGSLDASRVGLGVGAALSVLLYGGIVLAMRSSMVKTFDRTTRQLAGSR